MPRIPKLAATASMLLLAAAVPASAKIVSEAAMVSHCAEAAATELGVMMNDVLTLPAERSGGKYQVYGQYPVSGENITLFECQYDGNKNFLNINVKGKPSQQGTEAGGPAGTAQRACTAMMGGAVKVEIVSPLRPGFYEIIMKSDEQARRVACTASDKGTIEDWVELN